MQVHGQPGPHIQTRPTTLITVHGTAAQADTLVELINTETIVVFGKLPQPCANAPGCYLVEAFVDGQTTAELLRAAWLSRIAARN
jgi:hypothetical protein